MVRKIYMFFIANCPLLLFAQGTTIINGEIKNIKEGFSFVYFAYMDSSKMIMDSTPVNNNKYNYIAKISQPTIIAVSGKKRILNSRMMSKYVLNIFIEPRDNVDIISEDSFSNAKVAGSKANIEYIKLQESVKPFEKQMHILNTNYNEKENNNKVESENLENHRNSIKGKIDSIYSNYVNENPSSPIALYALTKYAGQVNLNVKKIGPMFNKLSISIKNTANGRAFAKSIEAATLTNVGALAPLFTQNDTLSTPVSLIAYRGKYVLINFWASWCGPCRVENSNLVAIFDRFKDKNFTILGISLDMSKEKWLEAIHKDKLTWAQISDLKFNNEVATLYGVQSIPQNFLIDPTGKIIAKNLYADDLQKALKELFN